MTAQYRTIQSETHPCMAHSSKRALSRQSMRIVLYAELAIVDLVALLAGPAVASLTLPMLHIARSDFMVSFAIIPIYVILSLNNGGYSIDALRRTVDSVRRALGAFTLAILVTLLIAFMLKSSHDVSRLEFGIGAIVSGALLVSARGLFPRHARHMTGGSLINDLLILDGKPMPVSHNASVVMNAEAAALVPDLNDPNMLDRFGRLAGAFDRIIVDSVPERTRQWALMLKGADIDGEILLDEVNAIGAIGMGHFNGRETLLVARKPLSVRNRLKKRILDLAITIPLLILVAPLLGLVALAIKLDTPGPVLFRQDRVGRGNRLFKVLKFRSMRVESSDDTGNRSTARGDDRVTRIGHFIRKSSIDELPQLINVLIGDMSLVGPRPHALGSLAGEQLFWQIDETYWHRHQLKPGITGLAQVRGFRGATVNKSDLTDRLQADMEYIAGWDIWRDITILLNTFRVVVHHNAF